MKIITTPTKKQVMLALQDFQNNKVIYHKDDKDNGNQLYTLQGYNTIDMIGKTDKYCFFDIKIKDTMLKDIVIINYTK